MIKSDLNINWNLSIKDFLELLEKELYNGSFFIDVETTGLLGSTYEQLTQISSIYTTYKNGKFEKVDTFNQKIKLTQETRQRFLNEETSKQLKWVLSFNHYGDGDMKYIEEVKSLDNFYRWILETNKSGNFIIQNSSFDMDMLNGRYYKEFTNNIIDTKMIIQLYYIPLLQKLSETDNKYKDILDKIGTSERDNGLISSSLSKIGPSMGLDMTNYHDGLKDCELTISMLENMIDFLKMNINKDIKKYQDERISTYII